MYHRVCVRMCRYSVGSHYSEPSRPQHSVEEIRELADPAVAGKVTHASAALDELNRAAREMATFRIAAEPSDSSKKRWATSA